MTQSITPLFAQCPLAVVPVRSRPDHRSEQRTQLLFGEIVHVLQAGKVWTRIRCPWDQMEGWVMAGQLLACSSERVEEEFAYSLEICQPAVSRRGALPIPFGARLPGFDGLRFRLGEESYQYSGQAVAPDVLEPYADLVMKLARRYLGAPYQWGGRSPFGIDAAGFVQLIFQLVDIPLPRTAAAQVLLGEEVDFVQRALPGDIAFFGPANGTVDHVGILLPGEELLHVEEQVRIDKVDHQGIFNERRQRYTRPLRVVRRVLPTEERAYRKRTRRAAGSGRQFELFG